jgi:hypothetical protein
VTFPPNDGKTRVASTRQVEDSAVPSLSPPLTWWVAVYILAHTRRAAETVLLPVSGFRLNNNGTRN